MSKTIKISVEAKTSLPWGSLEPFQDDIKIIAKEEYEQMRDNILTYGFSFAIHIWQNEGHNYVIDGHQRLFTVKQLAQIEGYEIPDIPVALIEADSFHQAKQKVLAGASQYGRLRPQALFDFMQNNDITLETLNKNFSFADLDLGLFSDSFFDLKVDDSYMPAPDAVSDAMPSSSDQVKSIQLFFDLETHDEFLNKITILSGDYKTENFTDSVMEAVRAEYTARQTKLR